MDHIIPLSKVPKGQLEFYALDISNLQILCNTCNSSKVAKIDGRIG